MHGSSSVPQDLIKTINEYGGKIKETYGVPAFNVNNLEAIRAIMEGAKELNSPVILQASGAARKYAGPIFVKKLVEAAMDEFSDIPTVLHQDHGGSPSDCKNCIELGFTSVMMDGSLMDDQKTPSDFDYNVRVTKETTDMAHALSLIHISEPTRRM